MALGLDQAVVTRDTPVLAQLSLPPNCLKGKGFVYLSELIFLWGKKEKKKKNLSDLLFFASFSMKSI